MAKQFKVGDKVVVNATNFEKYLNGRTGTVRFVIGDEVHVQFTKSEGTILASHQLIRK